jgi:methyl-accepting chemotaxis protein
MAAGMSFLMALVVGGVILFIAQQLKTDLVAVIEEDYRHIVDARAAEVGRLLRGYWNELSMLALTDALSAGSLSAARDLVEPMTSDDVSSIGVVDYAGTLALRGGQIIDVTEWDYYRSIFSEGKDKYVSNVLVPQGSTEPAVMLAQAVKRSDGTKLALVMQLSLRKLSDIVGEMDIGRGAYGWIIDQRSTVLAHPVSDLVMHYTFVEEADQGASGKSIRTLAVKMLAEERGVSSYIDKEGKEVTTFYATIPESPNWKIGVNVFTRDVYASIDRLLAILGIVFAIALALSIGIAITVARSIGRPVRLAAAEFRALASGDADLTKTLAVFSKDEIGDLVRDFNFFIAKLREMVVGLKDTETKLASIGEELSSSVQSSAGAVEQIGRRVEQMRLQARTQGDSVAESSSSVEEVARTISNLDSLIADQAAAITEASASIEQMIGNIGSVSSSVTRIASNFSSITDASDHGVSTQEEANRRVTEIAALSETLLEANEVIANIASQTNLLAMNAAIEAAHAGEAGKGFAVVADEIRRLAETSTEQSQSIGKGLKNVQETIARVVASSSETGAAFDKLAELIRATSNLVQEVGSAMGEQKEGSAQILSALKSMNEISAQVRAGSSEMSAGNASILDSIAALKSSAMEIDRSVDEVVLGIADVRASTETISAVTGRTGELLERMDEAVGRFRT